MSTSSQSVQQAVAESEPVDVDPVTLRGESLESTAPEYLRDLKRELAAEGYQPARLAVEACFDEDCSLATQAEADRLRGFVRAASFLGAGRIRVETGPVADEAGTRTALEALAERARREGVALVVDGPAAVQPSA